MSRLVAQQRRPSYFRTDCHLMQFAIGWNVAPDPGALVRLTSRFRGSVLRELLRLKSGGESPHWLKASRVLREAIAEMTGKDADGQRLQGPRRHAEFFAWWVDEQPTRLLVWRGSRAFDADEQEAILGAATREVSWAAAGNDADEWKVRLIPLDRAVPPPPGFEGTASAVWESVTPYVLPRHHLRSGKARASESITAQIQREIRARGIAERVEVEVVGPSRWVAVHVPRRDADQRGSPGHRPGHALRLRFNAPITGPLRLGHSSAFGLGLFRPVVMANHA